jgi:hypothetical protein
MPCPCGFSFGLGGPVNDCYYCQQLKAWGSHPATTKERIDEEFFIRVAGMTLAIRRLEQLEEDISAFPRIMSYEIADAINDHIMFGARTAGVFPLAPRLYRCNAGYGEIHGLLQTARNYLSDIKSFQNAFGYSIAPVAESRRHALFALVKRSKEYRA